MKNKMVSLFVAIMMFITISGCTAQENSLSGTAPDDVQIEDDGTDTVDIDQLSRVADGSNVDEQILSEGLHERKNIIAENNHTLEDVEEHELTGKDASDIFSEEKCESYSFSDVESGQYAVGDIIYTVGGDISSFEYAINWEPMGNYIRVGLINVDMNAIYFITCISGRGKGTIDITEIPTGDYYIFVYNETSNEINLMVQSLIILISWRC